MTNLPATYRRPSPSQAAADAIPILVDDTYHVFHLTTPPHTVHHPPRLRSTWSHLRSHDLVTWARDDAPALVPGTSDADDPDVSGAWTGSAVLGPDGNMNLFYTGYSLPNAGKQVIIRATTSDRHGNTGVASTRNARTPITVHGDTDLSTYFEDVDFRDAFVFYYAPEDEYWMLVATRLRSGPHGTRGCIARLVSEDGLASWRVPPGGPVLYAPGDLFCPECPELFSLVCAESGKVRWYLVYSRFAAPDAGTVYRVSETGPLGPFRVPLDGSRGRLDGRRWYAAKSCPMMGYRESKRVFFGWIADFHAPDGKWLWGGDLGIPRVVSIADAETGYLRVDPAPSVLEALSREREVSLEWSLPTRDTKARSQGHEFIQLQETGGTRTAFSSLDAEDVLVSIEFRKFLATSFGVALQTDHQGRGYHLRFTTTNSAMDTWSAVLLEAMIPLDDFWADQYQVYVPRAVDGPEILRHDGVHLDKDGGLRVTLLLHGDLVEVFFGGRSVSYRLTDRAGRAGVVGDTEASTSPRNRLGVFVEDGSIEFRVSVYKQ